MNLVVASIKLMRPTQWIKNAFVFMPVIFGARLLHLEDVLRVLEMFVAFCMTASATYVLNDYIDRDRDRLHPLKKHRPLASGAINSTLAFALTAVLIAIALVMAAVSHSPALGYAVLAGYVALQMAYSLWLKDMVILDVLSIASGFLLRVLAGAVVVDLTVSSWLVLCTFSVAIFLALGKRRHEVVILSENASNHRPVLENYNVALLDQLVQVATTSTFIFYCLYSVRGNPATGLQAERMMFTIPLVTYGLFRYLYLIYHKEEGGSPTVLLLTDPPLLICSILWLTACVAVLYL
ncbi:MAG: decaprenyl-phosphate phosphoribosyltransferase [Deltaproteobacteria bacterium]|nr:decaprenyl-phosphate phosphoribosyltransferase [Deltaproteobacteria bacterium]